MKTSVFAQSAIFVGLTLLLGSAISHAEVYRWIDENGRTHYSERKEDAGKAKAIELKAVPQPTSTVPHSSTPSWQEQERQLKQRLIKKQNETLRSTPLPLRPKSLSGGKEDGTDASRCALAQDVLSGAVRHKNGAPTDDYDRKVAENDIRQFCR